MNFPDILFLVPTYQQQVQDTSRPVSSTVTSGAAVRYVLCVLKSIGREQAVKFSHVSVILHLSVLHVGHFYVINVLYVVIILGWYNSDNYVSIKELMHCRVCRIQLKLPAGNTKVVEMDKADTLEALRMCVAKVYY